MQNAKNIFQPERRALKTGVLVLDGSSTISFAAVVDPMRAANRLASHPAFDWDYISATAAPVFLTSGLQVPAMPLAHVTDCELLIVIASTQVAQQTTPALLTGLRRLAAQGTALAAVDAGAWVLAEAGLLDGYAATLPAPDTDTFARRFPHVQMRRDRFVCSGPRLTSSGPLSSMDLMLHLVSKRHGRAFADSLHAQLFSDLPTQPVLAPDPDTLVARAQALMAQTLATPLPLAEIAHRLDTTPRSLQQQFRLHLDTTPQDHYLHLRLAEARRLVMDTDHPLMDIAGATGFTSQSSFARAFRTVHGLSARDLRHHSATAAQ